MKKLLPLFALLAFFLFSNQANAQLNPANQADTNTYVVTKNDGKEYIGKILSDDGREILIMTEALGKMFILKSDIRTIKKIENYKQIVNGEFRESGPFTTRYQFTANAFPLQKGENYAVINLYGPEVHFAVNNRLSLGVMTTWIASPFFIVGKYTFPSHNENINFSLGSMLGTSGYLAGGRGFGGLHWGSMTVGNRMSNFTVSVGYGYFRTGEKEQVYEPGYYVEPATPAYFTRTIPASKAPIISFAGITKVGSKASLVFDSMLGFSPSTENVYTYNPGTYDPVSGTYTGGSTTVTNTKTVTTFLMLMPGMRFQKNEHRAFQISLAGILSRNKVNSNSFPFPMCTWFYKF